MRQRRNFDAHVLEYAALKIPALPFQAEKRVFCKFAQHLHIAFACAAASLRKVTPQPASDHERERQKSLKKQERQRKKEEVRVLRAGSVCQPHFANLNFSNFHKCRKK